MKMDDTVEYAEEAHEYFSDCYCEGSRHKENLFGVGSLEDNYDVGEVLGEGGFGVVYAGQSKKDDGRVAIKHIDKRKLTRMAMVNRNYSKRA